MSAIAFHVSCDDPIIERRIQDTLHAADVGDDQDEMDEHELARLERRKADRVYFKTMRKSYVRR